MSNLRILLLLSLAALADSACSAEPVDHVAMIKSLNAEDVKKGAALYAQHCVSGHGKDGNVVVNPLARRFAKDAGNFYFSQSFAFLRAAPEAGRAPGAAGE